MANSTVFPLLIAFGGLFLGALLLFVGWYIWYESHELRSSGLTVTATVLKKFRKADPGLWGNLESYYAQCQFLDPAGQSQEVDVYMRSKLWYQVSEGTTTQLTYVPDELDEPQPGSRLGWQLRGIIGIGLMTLGSIMIAVLTIGGIQEWVSANQGI